MLWRRRDTARRRRIVARVNVCLLTLPPALAKLSVVCESRRRQKAMHTTSRSLTRSLSCLLTADAPPCGAGRLLQPGRGHAGGTGGGAGSRCGETARPRLACTRLSARPVSIMCAAFSAGTDSPLSPLPPLLRARHHAPLAGRVGGVAGLPSRLARLRHHRHGGGRRGGGAFRLQAHAARAVRRRLRGRDARRMAAARGDDDGAGGGGGNGQRAGARAQRRPRGSGGGGRAHVSGGEPHPVAHTPCGGGGSEYACVAPRTAF